MAKGLTHAQNNEYMKYKKLQQFFMENMGQISGYAPLNDEVADFNTNLAALEAQIPVKSGDSGGIAQTKDAIQEELAVLGEQVCLRAHAFALKNNDKELAASTRYSAEKIRHLKDADVQPVMRNIYDAVSIAMNNKAFGVYGVTTAMLSTLANQAQAFNDLVGKPKAAMNKNAVANADIEAELAKLRAGNKQFDLLMSTYKVSDADFFNGYMVNNEAPDLGVRHTGLEGYVKDAVTGDGIAGAQVQNAGTGRTEMSDITGAYAMIKFKAGTYIFEVSAPGYAMQKVTLSIERGKVLECDFSLKAQ